MDKQVSHGGLLHAVTFALRDIVASLGRALLSALTSLRALHVLGHTSCSNTTAGVNAVAKHDMACRYCSSGDLRRSRSRWYDPAVRLVLRGWYPYRCLACRWRQWQRVPQG